MIEKILNKVEENHRGIMIGTFIASIACAVMAILIGVSTGNYPSAVWAFIAGMWMGNAWMHWDKANKWRDMAHKGLEVMTEMSKGLEDLHDNMMKAKKEAEKRKKEQEEITNEANRLVQQDKAEDPI
jgi:hypothetical protein